MEVTAGKMCAEENTDAEAADFSLLFQSHYPRVVRQIMSVVREQAAAEELAQEVFIRLYYADRDTIANLPGWISRAALYAAFNYLRSEKRRMEREEKERAEPRTSPSSEERWLEREEIAAVRETLTGMEERDRLLLLMKYSGYNYKELADAAGVEQGSVGTLLARAKKKFRELYQRGRRNET